MFGFKKLDRKSNHSLDSGASCSPGRNSVFTSTRKPVRDKVQNSAMYSQERRRDDNPCATSTKKPNWAKYQEPTCKKEVGLPQDANLRRTIQSLRQILSHRESEQILDQKTNALIWELYYANDDESSNSPYKNYNENLVKYKNTIFEEIKTLFAITQRLILKQDFEILNVSTIELTFFHG